MARCRSSPYRNVTTVLSLCTRVKSKTKFWVRLLLRHEIHVLAEPLVAFRIRANQMNASAARPEVLARDAWEQLRVFEQYLALSPAEFEQVFLEAAGRNRELPVGWRLGRLALDLPRPAAVMFGLEAIYDALRRIRDPARIREFIALSGAYDPFAVTAPVSPDRLLAAPVMPPPPGRGAAPPAEPAAKSILGRAGAFFGKKGS